MTKSTLTKLSILIGLLISILVFAFVMYSQIETIEDVELTTSSFEDEIKNDCNVGIPDGTHSNNYSAVSFYYQLVDEITTESLLGKIDDKTNKECVVYTQKAILSYVENVSKGIISNGRWTRGTMESVRKTCEQFSTLDAITSDQKSRFSYYCTTVEKYFSALSVVASSAAYSGIENAKNLIAKADQLKGDKSLQPCKQIISELGQVRQSLYDVHLAYVKRSVDEDNCNEFVADASTYGHTEKEAENAIKDVRVKIDATRVKKVGQSIHEDIDDISDSAW